MLDDIGVLIFIYSFYICLKDTFQKGDSKENLIRLYTNVGLHLVHSQAILVCMGVVATG